MTRKEAVATAHTAPKVIVEVLLQLIAWIEELERKVALLARDPFNFSKPSLSDRPAARPEARPPVSSQRRSPGGQPGHKGANTNLIPAEEVVEVISVLPGVCHQCGAVLASASDHA